MAIEHGIELDRTNSRRVGLQFEEAVRAELVSKLDNKYHFVHNALVGEKLGRNEPEHDVDFLVVGPNGVFAVEAKSWTHVRGNLWRQWSILNAMPYKGPTWGINRKLHGVVHRTRLLQVSERLEKMREEPISAYRRVRGIFVFPDGARIELTDDDNVSPPAGPSIWCVRLSELCRTIESMERPQRGRLTIAPLSNEDVRSVMRRFERHRAQRIDVPDGYSSELIANEIELPNGVRYVPYKLRHNALGAARRAKRYDLLSVNQSDLEQFREQIRRHASVMEAVQGRHFGRLYEFIENDGSDGAWIIDEWIEGRTLSELLDSEALPLSRCLSIGGQLAEALRELHAKGYACRVLDPETIVVRDETGEVVLTDFELAKALGSNATVSKTGAWAPDPFTAPEVAENPRLADQMADVYSLGAIMYRLIVGRDMHRPGDVSELQRAAITPGLAKTLAACLSPFPRNRPRSVDEVLRALL